MQPGLSFQGCSLVVGGFGEILGDGLRYGAGELARLWSVVPDVAAKQNRSDMIST